MNECFAIRTLKVEHNKMTMFSDKVVPLYSHYQRSDFVIRLNSTAFEFIKEQKLKFFISIGFPT